MITTPSSLSTVSSTLPAPCSAILIIVLGAWQSYFNRWDLRHLGMIAWGTKISRTRGRIIFKSLCKLHLPFHFIFLRITFAL